jgi:hypothetical protein
MSSANMSRELDILAEKYITDFGLRTHKELKRIGEFKDLPENSQRKLYDKVRYKTQKGNLKLVSENFILESRKTLVENNKPRETLKGQIKKIPTALLLAFIFCFLASESLKFYDQFEILPIFKYSIPLVIEFSVLLLSLKKSKLASFLLAGLIVFNTATFIYKTIECDKNTRREREVRKERVIFFKEQKGNIEKQIQEASKNLSSLRKQHEDLVAKNYFKLANSTFQESIKANENQFQYLQAKLEKANFEILNGVDVRESNSFLSVETFFMIALKCILQAIFIFLIFDLKKQSKTKGEI